ncbi:MAG: HIT domain-containing protein [Candidatus Pacearchaeota archaeon]
METCIFCKIVKGEIPCYKVYEDKKYLAFLDIAPRNPGHTLVIPKKHYRWVWDVEDIAGYYKVVGKVANAIRRALMTEWVVSLVLGEEVPHAHVWLVPRFPNDGHGASINLDNIKNISKEEMQKIAEAIEKKIKKERGK